MSAHPLVRPALAGASVLALGAIPLVALGGAGTTTVPAGPTVAPVVVVAPHTVAPVVTDPVLDVAMSTPLSALPAAPGHDVLSGALLAGAALAGAVGARQVAGGGRRVRAVARS